MHKGAEPSCGGSRVFCGVGGTRPPRSFPGGETEKGRSIPCAAGYFCFATLKCSIHLLCPGGGTCRRAGRLRSLVISHLTAFAHTVSVTNCSPIRVCSVPSSRSSTRIDDRRNPGRTAAFGICHRPPPHATV